MKRNEIIVVEAGPTGMVAAIAAQRKALRADVPDSRMLLIKKIHSARRFPVAFVFAALAGLAAMILTPASWAQGSVYQLDPAQTKIEYSLSGTMHTVHGKFALKSGAIRFDPATEKMDGMIIVDATSGDSGNGGRDARMHREILESSKFPEIIFTPLKITGTVAGGGPSKVEVSGQFRLHGQDHDVTLPIDVRADGPNIQLTTHIDIPYVKWAMKNPSNFFLRVSDVVAIDIQARGGVHSAGNP